MSALEWYKVRDTALGINFVEQNFGLAVEFARKSSHPDCVWFAGLFADCPFGKSDMTRVLLKCGDDARAMSFLAVLTNNESLLRKAATLGDPFAQAMMAKCTLGDECFEFASAAAASGDRDGFYFLGRFYENGDMDAAQECYEKAARENHAFAAFRLGKCFAMSDPRRFFWAARAGLCGNCMGYVGEIATLLSLWPGRGSSYDQSVFQVGETLKRHLVVEPFRRLLFGKAVDSFILTQVAVHDAIVFYEENIAGAANAVNCWSVCARRLGVVKDIRILIGKMVWEARGEATYKSWKK
jgi:hypothetical protein